MVRQIAENINLSAATVTSILDRLEIKALVHRIRSTEDKRRVGVFLTEKGQELIASAPMPLQEHFLSRFENLEDWEQSLMVATLQRLASMMDAEDLEVAPVLELGVLDDKVPVDMGK